MTTDESQVFMCRKHQFFIVVHHGMTSCSDTPGYGGNSSDCTECHRAVDEALAAVAS